MAYVLKSPVEIAGLISGQDFAALPLGLKQQRAGTVVGAADTLDLLIPVLVAGAGSALEGAFIRALVLTTPAPLTGSAPDLHEESRRWSVATVESVRGFAGQPFLLADLTGPGSVESIQLAYFETASATESLMRVTVDGVIHPPVPVGLFYLTYGNPGLNGPNGGAALFLTDRLGVQRCQGDSAGSFFGGFRQIFIPYAQHCRIECIPIGGYAAFYSQVQFYPGAAPAGKTGTRRKWLGLAYLPQTTVAATNPFTLLDVTGRGTLDSVQVAYSQSGTGNFTFLEGNPTFHIDGSVQAFGGTEDFYGTQFYGFGSTCNRWGNPVNNLPDNARTSNHWNGYRFFDGYDPVVFDASLSLIDYNGQQGQSDGTDVTVSTLAIYYLDTPQTQQPAPSALAQALLALSPQAGFLAGERCTRTDGQAAQAGNGSGTVSSVASWRDLTGNTPDATQYTAARQPRLVASAVNGKAGVLFDAVDDALVTQVNIQKGTAGYTILCVEVPGTSGGGGRRTVGSLAAAPIFASLHRSDANKVYINGHVASQGASAGVPHIWSVSCPPSGNYQVHIDGVNVTDGSVAGSDWGVLTIGAANGDAGGTQGGEPADTTIRALWVCPYAQRTAATALLAGDAGITLPG